MARRTGFPRRPRSDDLTADVLYDQYGRDFAADLRAGVAPNQREDDMLPPCAILNATGRQKDDGTPEFKAGKRYMGATGMVLRRDCAQRDSPDSRYGTLNGAARLKEALGEQGRALRGRNPVTGDRPQPVQVRSNFASQVQSVHQQDGEGYNARGELGPVKKGDPIYDEGRNRAPDTYEARRTYPAYHLSDFDIQNMPERSQPMSRDWAIEEGNRRFAEKCKAAGAEVREPDDEERAICNIEYAMDRVLDKEAARGTVVNRDVEDLKKIEFSVGPEGEATLSVPKDEAFADVHEKYTQLAVATAHAHLYREAHARAADAEARNEVDQAAEDRIEAYKLAESKRPYSAEFARAELAATYAGMTEVTGHCATYVPPASTHHKKMVETWAQTLEAPGGLAAVGRDVQSCESYFNARRVSQERNREQQRDRAPARVDEQGNPVPGGTAQEAARRARAQMRAERQPGGQPQEHRGGVPDRAALPAGAAAGTPGRDRSRTPDTAGREQASQADESSPAR